MLNVVLELQPIDAKSRWSIRRPADAKPPVVRTSIMNVLTTIGLAFAFSTKPQFRLKWS